MSLSYCIIIIGKADCLCEQNSADGVSLSNKILTGEVKMHQKDEIEEKPKIALNIYDQNFVKQADSNGILENF